MLCEVDEAEVKSRIDEVNSKSLQDPLFGSRGQIIKPLEPRDSRKEPTRQPAPDGHGAE